MFPFSAAAPIVDLFIYVFVFTLCLGVFPFFFFFSFLKGRVFFSIFHLSHLVEFSALISSLWYGVRRFRNNCQVQIKNGWSGCNIELLNTSRDLSDGYGTRFFIFFFFPPLHFFLCLCQLRGFLSVVRTMRGWCRHSEGDVLYSDLVQMHPIMIMFCYLYAPPAPVPLLWKKIWAP